MADPILEEISRTRAKLLKQHGGMAGYFEHVRSLDRARRKQRKKVSKRKSKIST